MSTIPYFDPESGEVQSPLIAGITEGLNKISSGVALHDGRIEKEQLNPVPGLDLADECRIYQVKNGKRLWSNSPSPEIYVNDSPITPSEHQFKIDLIGGSITFFGSYRPSKSDVVTVTANYIEYAQSTFSPAGTVIWFAGSTPPDGWIVCNGAAISRSDYSALFAVIGTTFGEGDGSTTFEVPDLHAKIIEGNRLTIGKEDTFVAGQGSRLTRTLTLLPCIKY